MEKILYPDNNKKREAIKRPNKPETELDNIVRKIFSAIKQDGDKALIKYTLEFDRVSLESVEVDKETIAASRNRLPDELKNAISQAAANIRTFHESQQDKPVFVETVKGVRCWRESRPIERVGIYVPGGSAPLFSTVLMLAIPAKIAGCREIILTSPPTSPHRGEKQTPATEGIHPAILFAADFVGVDRIFSVGGIQAIGAMTYGTETIPKVSKIFGPGNQYVTMAKQIAQTSGNVAIDMPAGPSEVLIIADKTCNPVFVAADLLSQAEHGIDSQAVLLTDSEEVADRVIAEVTIQVETLPRRDIAVMALENSKVIVLNNIDECIALSNEYAPEHLILACEDTKQVAKQIVNAGSVFIGNYSCESAGDYASGTNHTLPTNGYAKNYSGVSLDSFVKKITFQEISAEGIANIGPTIEIMAAAEKLDAHKNAVSLRLKDLKK
ncbi:MAG: histidinol dehydrogenase [Prevotellaceae bacterium]|jgi:histidinol dehydrogenase|nr:histidinol dehydrogenase [Prevotellaceae bacterium]